MGIINAVGLMGIIIVVTLMGIIQVIVAALMGIIIVVALMGIINVVSPSKHAVLGQCWPVLAQYNHVCWGLGHTNISTKR